MPAQREWEPSGETVSGTNDTERPPAFADLTAVAGSTNEPRPRTMPVPRNPKTAPFPFEPASTPRLPVGEATNVGLPSLPTAALTRKCATCQELYPSDFLVCPRDATPLVDATTNQAPDPLIGKLLGETYRIVRVVGEGGMGRVYEARHLRLKERRFAVKCLHAELARNAEMSARFLREAESASSIKHPNVVDVFDVHHLPDGVPYLVSELLEGEELADYVKRRGPLDARMAARVGRQVANALGAAHERGIVHRDMKPENIFVLAASMQPAANGETRPLEVKVLDFGISKAVEDDASNLTRTGVIMGTPSYMAPEQARGRPVDARADVYSLGACLYFMVTGRRPFDSDDPTSTLSMVLTEDPVRPRAIDERIPEGLELVIQRAMAKDPSDRYVSMEDLESALTAFLANDRGRASVPSVPSAREMIPVTPPAPRIQQSGAQRAFDVAKTVLGSDSLAPKSPDTAKLAAVARPTIVVASVAIGAWLVGVTVAGLAGLVRVLHDDELTLTEGFLLIVGCLFAAATPAALYVMHLRKVIWPNTVKAVQLASDLKRVAVAALAAYGSLAIAARIFHTVFLRSSPGLASGVWDMLLFVVSFAVAGSIGGFAPFLRRQRKRRPTV